MAEFLDIQRVSNYLKKPVNNTNHRLQSFYKSFYHFVIPGIHCIIKKIKKNSTIHIVYLLLHTHNPGTITRFFNNINCSIILALLERSNIRNPILCQNLNTNKLVVFFIPLQYYVGAGSSA